MNVFDVLADMINISWMGEGVQKFAGIITLSIALVWVLIIIGVAFNISKRTDNIWMQIFCIILATIGGPLGLLIYRVVRPPKRNHADGIMQGYEIICPFCKNNNSFDNNYCIHCGKALKIACKECKTMIDPSVEYCGVCGAPNL